MKEVVFVAKCDECSWEFKGNIELKRFDFVNAMLDNVKYNRNIHRRYARHNPGIRAYIKDDTTTA